MSKLDLHANPLAWRSFISVLLFVVFWEIAGLSHVAPAILLPPFSVVAKQMWHSTLDGTLVADLSLSLARAFCGLLLATVGGVILGLLMARNRAIEWLADPLVALGFPSPKIAFIPIFILWFGIESLSEGLACRICLHIPRHHRDLQCCPRREQAIYLVGPLARQQPSKFVSACDPSGLLSTHFHNLPNCRTSRSHHHVHGGDGRRRRRHGRDLDLLTAVFRKLNGFCLYCGDVDRRPRV